MFCKQNIICCHRTLCYVSKTLMCCHSTLCSCHMCITRPFHRDISTLSGVLMLVAQDLYVGYHAGFTCEDYNLPFDSPQRLFQCKVCLLYITGDYPALAKMTGFVHAGSVPCHWCLFQGKKDMAINRIDSGTFRRWLPARSANRAAGGNFDMAEHRPPPPLREHHASVRTGVLGSNHTGAQKHHPAHTTGISEWCPLVVIPLFDIIFDAPGDAMHLVLWFKRNMIPAMKGKTSLASPTFLSVNSNPKTDLESEECEARLKTNQSRYDDGAKQREVPAAAKHYMLQTKHYVLSTEHYVLLQNIICCRLNIMCCPQNIMCCPQNIM